MAPEHKTSRLGRVYTTVGYTATGAAKVLYPVAAAEARHDQGARHRGSRLRTRQTPSAGTGRAGSAAPDREAARETEGPVGYDAPFRTHYEATTSTNDEDRHRKRRCVPPRRTPCPYPGAGNVPVNRRSIAPRSAIPSTILCNVPKAAAADWDVNAVSWALYLVSTRACTELYAADQRTWRQSLDPLSALPREQTAEDHAGRAMAICLGG